jgi:phosphoribosyl-AMP cyclohydrolase
VAHAERAPLLFGFWKATLYDFYNTQVKNMSDNWIENLKYDQKGLIPAITQDHQDGAILMMAWMNRQALELTISTGEVHYWSRSRQELWHKGATSGHIQKLKQLYYDCDRDVILVKIEQVGGIACHTGERSCFFTEVPLN